MKVTVCFGPVSVVVPCGNGDILVRDLISQAVTRYRKASNKSNDAAISVAALRSSDGAILDPDDRLADVVDDREQLAACLSNGGSGSELDEASLGVPLVLGPRIGLMNLRGDGTSASSNSGSPSPTDFGLHHQHYGGSHHPSSRKDIEVTGQEAATGLMVDHLHLQVRRGSEPALNRISPDGPTITNGPASAAGQHHQADVPPTSNTRDYKRWSAAPIVDPTSDSDCEERDLEVVRRHPSGPRFARSGARVSMQIFGGGVGSSNGVGGGQSNAGYRWAEAADNALLSAATAPATTTPPDYEETMHRRTRSLRREPVGATSESIPLSDGHHHLYHHHHHHHVQSSVPTQLVVLPNEGGQPLGIHVVPDYSPLGNELGLLVQGVEPGGRIHRDGRIAVQDRIVEINSHPLKDVPFHRAQELFRNALQAAQEEQKRIQHHYLRLMDQQQRQAAAHEQQKQQQQQSGATTGDSTNRSQRLHQLRAQHQKRHAEQQRQSTHTPTEQFESNNKNMAEIAHGRSASYDPYNDVRKPRSRAAVGEPNTLMPIPTVSSMYNNNYDEFQLNRRQQHYHSQRSARETRMSPPGGNAWSGSERPVSNYFEYESLHIAGHKVALSGPPYKPQQHQQQQQQQQGQQSSNRRPPTMQGDEGPAFFRRPDRNSTGLEYGSNQVRSSQRESVYGASNYGSQNNPSRPAPLTGSKV
ncbi:Partitioning defective 3-like protein [Daphnia magna]|uniref:Partitioning defective 3-like protein n=1 Tax=Daphnia magna TaxID=35525 RepID=A0A162DH76_9CRUS|nr:Partitioning defective 3-like protein [Daphnia magna]